MYLWMYLRHLRRPAHLLNLSQLKRHFSFFGSVYSPAHGQHALQWLADGPAVRLFLLPVQKEAWMNNADDVKIMRINMALFSPSLWELCRTSSLGVFSIFHLHSLRISSPTWPAQGRNQEKTHESDCKPGLSTAAVINEDVMDLRPSLQPISHDSAQNICWRCIPASPADKRCENKHEIQYNIAGTLTQLSHTLVLPLSHLSCCLFLALLFTL